MAHRALADIHESIRELDYYRRTLFVAPPGPTSEEAHAVAAALPPRRRTRRGRAVAARYSSSITGSGR